MHDPARPDRTVVLVGGVRTPSNALVGPVTVAALRTLHVDALILGVHGVTAGEGLTTPNLMEAETSRARVACARRGRVAVDHTKWGVGGLAPIADLDRVDVLVTDSGISADARRSLDEIVGQVVVAEVTRPASGSGAAVDEPEQDVS
jgi:DeoR/GlpR family transcriptional regulator of sugar metabolism